MVKEIFQQASFSCTPLHFVYGKIYFETRRAFFHLPRDLTAATQAHSVGRLITLTLPAPVLASRFRDAGKIFNSTIEFSFSACLCRRTLKLGCQLS